MSSYADRRAQEIADRKAREEALQREEMKRAKKAPGMPGKVKGQAPSRMRIKIESPSFQKMEDVIRQIKSILNAMGARILGGPMSLPIAHGPKSEVVYRKVLYVGGDARVINEIAQIKAPSEVSVKIELPKGEGITPAEAYEGIKKGKRPSLAEIMAASEKQKKAEEKAARIEKGKKAARKRAYGY